MGSAIFVSIAVIHVRKQAFERKLQELADNRERRLLRPLSFTFSSKRRHRTSSNSRSNAEPDAFRGRTVATVSEDTVGGVANPDTTTNAVAEDATKDSDVDEPGVPSSKTRIRFADDVNPPITGGFEAGVRSRRQSLSKVFSNTGVGAHSIYHHPRTALPPAILGDEPNFTNQMPKTRQSKYIDTVNGYMGRNSQFHNLTEEERRKLGGIEYDALCILSWLVPAYFVLFQLFGAIGCGAWMQVNRPSLAYSNGKFVADRLFQH